MSQEIVESIFSFAEDPMLQKGLYFSTPYDAFVKTELQTVFLVSHQGSRLL